MCGIVGYVGKERCVEVLMEGLRHLEYRGYDSAGLALQGGRADRAYQGGRPAQEPGAGRRGAQRGSLQGAGRGRAHALGDARAPERGERPPAHRAVEGPVAVVHNGIIENHAELKEELKGRGVVFRSETDTEVMAHLLAERVEAGEPLREALAGDFEEARRVVRGRGDQRGGAGDDRCGPAPEPARRRPRERGRTSWRARFRRCSARPDEFLVRGERRDRRDHRLIGRASSTLEGEPVERETFEVDWDAEAVELGGYEDFMLKEIHEQPAALGATLARPPRRRRRRGPL